GRAPRGGVRPHARAPLPPARRCARRAAGAAGSRLDHDRYRDALPDRRVSVLPDPGGRRVAHPGGPSLTRGLDMSDAVLKTPEHTSPKAFTRAQLDWLPWLEPLAADALTPRHLARLVDGARGQSASFRLLAPPPRAL